MDSGFPMKARVVYDGDYIHDWLKGEGSGERDSEFTRTAATIKAGQGKLPHGAVLGIEAGSGKYVWHQNGASDGSETAVGLLLYPVDATANDVDVAVLVRRAVVIAGNLKFHDSVDDAAKKAAAMAQLATREIVSRQEL